MSHDASPSSPPRVEQAPVPSSSPPSRRRAQSQSHSQRRRRRRSRKGRLPGLSKKLDFVTHLLKGLDTLVFAELSALYYMECSMFRFVLRAAGQYTYLTPKVENFPFHIPPSRGHAMAVLIPNAICILLHLFCALPEGPDYHGGYMHGGMIIDFVGQQPSKSRIYYILADLAIMLVQSLMLTVHAERERLRIGLKTFRPAAPDQAREISMPTIEDLDAEERGVSRHTIIMDSATASETNENEIEMQPLRRASDADGNDASPDSASISRESTSDETSRTNLSDVLSSGNAVLGEFHILHTIRNAGTDLERTAAHSLRSISYGATLAALEAQRRGANVTVRTVQND